MQHMIDHLLFSYKNVFDGLYRTASEGKFVLLNLCMIIVLCLVILLLGKIHWFLNVQFSFLELLFLNIQQRVFLPG